MIRALLLAAALSASPASAQIVSSLAPPASASDVDTRIAAATAGLCGQGTTVPQPEALTAYAGASSNCLRADARIPRITRAGATSTTDSAGNWSITWTTPLSATPAVLPIPITPAGTTQPIICSPIAMTANGASGRCWYSRTLPATITVLTNLVSYDVFGTAAAGITVQVFAIPMTQ